MRERGSRCERRGRKGTEDVDLWSGCDDFRKLFENLLRSKQSARRLLAHEQSEQDILEVEHCSNERYRLLRPTKTTFREGICESKKSDKQVRSGEEVSVHINRWR